MMKATTSGKTALVTGGTDGIGKEIARGLATAGHLVTVVGRDEAKGKRAVQEIKEATGNERITHICADVSLMVEVNRLADVVDETCFRQTCQTAQSQQSAGLSQTRPLAGLIIGNRVARSK